MDVEIEKLVHAAMSGDRKAFDELVHLNYRKAVSVASRLLSNIDDGLEVAQQAFLKAYESLDQLKEPDRFGSWLMSVSYTHLRAHET